MNYDDLLARIDLLAQPSAGSSNYMKPSFHKAIRAVVELPKETSWDGGWEDADAFQHGYRLAMSKVIQAIEEQLK